MIIVDCTVFWFASSFEIIFNVKYSKAIYSPILGFIILLL